jgi:hypothetical protein
MVAFMSWALPRRNSLTADAQIVTSPTPDQGDSRGLARRRLYRTPDEWQREVWDFYDSLGEFGQGITWKSNMLSRVRLVAARKDSPESKPEPITTGPAADIMRDLAGGVGGQAALMSSFAVYLNVPGECYLIGETNPSTERNTWYTRSIEEVIPAFADGDYRYKISEGNGHWRVLPSDSLVVRVWRPHKRWHNVATSPARGCRTLLRELELINRHIQSQYLSRLASAGVILFPEEVTFPVRPEFADAPDPFVAEWIEIAAEAIRTPGTAASVVPIPIKVPGEYVDKIKNLDFTLKLDDKIIEKRDSGLTRLAISLDMPPEALLGTKDVNHWNAWLIDEQGVKIHIAPDAEIVCDALTSGYLLPRLEAAGEDIDGIVVWYDASELILRPDRSTQATDAYDRGELKPSTYRAAIGFDETDKPSDEELKKIAYLKIALTQPVNSFSAVGKLFPEEADDLPPDMPADANRPDPSAPAPAGRNPEDQKLLPKAKPAERAAAAAAAAEIERKQLLESWHRQAELQHAIRISFTDGWQLLHPAECNDHLFSCPVTHAVWKPVVSARPGGRGVYECWLNPHNQPIIGRKITDLDVRGMTPTVIEANGSVVKLTKT